MEDAVSDTPAGHLLENGAEVRFSEIEAALGRVTVPEGRRASGLALTATVVVVGPPERLTEAADALTQLSDIAIRAILISYGDSATPVVRVAEHAVALDGLTPHYLNNAVAALRLSSLPTLVWWRGGAPELLDGLANLADRLVLDAEDPQPVWARVGALAERAATSDLRWTRLTRWRALTAHFWDIPEMRAAAGGFNRLQIVGSDLHAARLYAAWLVSTLKWTPATLDVRERQGGPAIESVELGDGEQELTLRTASNGTCIETAARVRGHAGYVSRIVSFGDQGLSALIAEELRIRSRDLAFERAVASVGGLA
jgi:glucose-6-phosphate dehydrogenase assembly protein OpcA